MSTWRSTPRGAENAPARTKYKVDKSGVIPPRPVPPVAVTSLQIVDDDDVNCDPYNRTGSFYVEDFKEDRG